MSAARIVHAAAGVAAISAADRGFNYGDGVFTTLRVHAGAPVWWDAHWARLVRDASALAIALPDEAKARAAAHAACGGVKRAVLKLVLTRGEGGRGYAPQADAKSTFVVGLHDMPARAPDPLAVRWCDLRLAIQPRLAGLKHLNRLEQVLARAEWDDEKVFEGLLRDSEGRVVCATAANLFVRRGERWLTPPVRRCGVAGVMRAWCLQALGAAEADFEPADVEAADALFLCNAVRGILPVHRLGTLRWPADAAIADLRRRLAAAEPAFATE
jgi:4-amino-4-deoxychorismate lyase